MGLKKKVRKAVWCEDCQHYSPVELYAESPAENENKQIVGMEFSCDKNHKPYFYKPKDWTRLQFNNFGYKRRCEDFIKLRGDKNDNAIL